MQNLLKYLIEVIRVSYEFPAEIYLYTAGWV